MKRDLIKDDPFGYAEELSQRLPRLAEGMNVDYAYGVLNGTDCVSRALAEVPVELEHKDWEALPIELRERLMAAYRNLGSRAVLLCEEMGENGAQCLPNPDDNEREQLHRYAQTVSYAGGVLGSLGRIEEFQDSLNMGTVVGLASATLETLLEWKDYQAYFGVGAPQSTYALEKMAVGLEWIGKVCDSNSGFVDVPGTALVSFE